MKAPRKVRPDSPLENLSEARQAEIFEMTVEGPENRTYREISQYLEAECQISVDEKRLSAWRNRYWCRQMYAEAEEARLLAIEERRRTHPGATEDELFAFGQAIFQDQALKQQDAKTWVALHRLRLAGQAGERDSRRLALLEKRAAQDEKARDKSPAEMTPEEREVRMERVFGLR